MEAKEYITLTNSASKRALFPPEPLTPMLSDDEDSLGHMSPLRSSSPDRYSSPCASLCQSIEGTPLKMTDADDLRENVRFDKLNLASNLQCFSPRESTPQKVITEIIDDTPQKVIKEVIDDTPQKEYEDDILTPFKCLIRRRNIEETPDSIVSERADVLRNLCRKKDQVVNSPEKRNVTGKNFDFNSSVANLIKNSFYRPANSKAKTALFVDKLQRPAVKVVSKIHPVRPIKSNFSKINSRKNRRRTRAPGEINAGVRHKVKKPKMRVKRSIENVQKCSEKPLISPQDRVEKFIMENNLLDEENTPVKRPRLENTVSMNERSKEEQPHSERGQVMDVNYMDCEETSKIEIIPDPKKKFFKTNRTMAIDHKATVTVVNNVKIQVHNGKMALGNSPARKMKPFKKRPVLLENMYEDDAVIDNRNVQETVQNVLQKLDNETVVHSDDSHHIQSITTSTSSLALHDIEMANELENDVENQKPVDHVSGEKSPESLNVQNQYPKNIINDTGSAEDSKRLYPVFYKRKALHESSNANVKKISPHFKKMRLIGGDQYQIDAGQSRFRAVHCNECGTLYHVGDPEDELAHYNIHYNISTFKFNGWKNEHVIKLYANSERIIVIYPDDPKVWVNKAKDILKVVDKELGIVDGGFSDIGYHKVYLYVLKHRIVGILAAEPISVAYRMLDTGIGGPDCCSEETYPAKCGISRVWTATDQRRKKVATRLLDSLRLTFMFDHILDKKDIAFSVPTDSGKAFATKYMNTAEFMVYYK